MNERPAGAHEMNVGFIQMRCFVRQHARSHFDACLAQVRKATTGNFWIGIFDRRHYAFDSGLDERVGAGLSAALMRVRFQRDVSGRCRRSRSGLIQRDRLGVLDLIEDVEAFTGDLSVSIDDHCADEGAGTDLSNTARGEFERALDHALVEL